MTTPTEMTIALEPALFQQGEALALRLNMTPRRLFEMAVEDFIRQYARADEVDEGRPPVARVSRLVNQGDIYWVQLESAVGLEPRIRHPHVVVQDNVFNHSRLKTVVACALTSNVERVSLPGNVLLEAGEGNLPRQSVVEVSKVSTVNKARLGEYIGSVGEQRVRQVLEGLRFVEEAFLREG